MSDHASTQHLLPLLWDGSNRDDLPPVRDSCIRVGDKLSWFSPGIGRRLDVDFRGWETSLFFLFFKKPPC